MKWQSRVAVISIYRASILVMILPLATSDTPTTTEEAVQFSPDSFETAIRYSHFFYGCPLDQSSSMAMRHGYIYYRAIRRLRVFDGLARYIRLPTAAQPLRWLIIMIFWGFRIRIFAPRSRFAARVRCWVFTVLYIWCMTIVSWSRF